MKAKLGYGLNRKDYILILLLACVFTLSAVLILVQYFHTKDRVEAGRRQGSALAARYAARQISDFLEHEQATLVSMAGLLALSGNLEKGKDQLGIVLKAHKRPRKLFTFFVMDKNGRFQYSAPESLVDRYMEDLSGQGCFRTTAKTCGFSCTGAQPDGKGGWAMMLCAPIMSSAGNDKAKLLGVLAEKIDIGALDEILAGSIEVGRDGYAFLVDENGRVLANKNGGQQYQVENSSETLARMLGGAEGIGLKNSPDTGRPQLVAFSPVISGGRTWSVGVVIPASGDHADAARSLELTLLIMSLTAMAFVWSVMSMARARRYRASISERIQASDHLMQRNRELTTLNDLTGAICGSVELDGLFKRTLDVIITDLGAKGGAVKLFSPSGGLVLKARSGVPATCVEKTPCAGALQICGSRALTEGRPEYLSKEALSAADPECSDVPWGLLLVPLLEKEKPLGVLYLWGLKEEEYTEQSAKFLLDLGGLMAHGLENVIQMEDTKRHSSRASALFHTAEALTRSLDLDALLNIIMQETASLLKVKRCLLLLYNEETNRIDCRVALGFSKSPAGALSFSPSGVFWEAMEDGEVKVVEPGETRPDLPRMFTEGLGLDGFIVVPLVSRGKVLGFIVLEMLGGDGGMLEDIKFMVGFANQAAVAIETSSFYIRTVEKYNEDLQRLSKRIIEAQEEERKRLSRDLHDELGQLLTAIKINLDMATASLPAGPGFEQVRSRLGDAENLVLSTLESVRRLSFELRPSMLDDLGLSTVIGKLISDFKKRTGIEVEFLEEGPAERLNPRIEVVLYRVVQEALTNIAKHAKATRVVVSLKKDPQKEVIGLRVEDNGAGFSLRPDGYPRDPNGFGLMGIKERVSLLGGNFRISTDKDKGTRLLIDIPWTKEKEETWKKA